MTVHELTQLCIKREATLGLIRTIGELSYIHPLSDIIFAVNRTEEVRDALCDIRSAVCTIKNWAEEQYKIAEAALDEALEESEKALEEAMAKKKELKIKNGEINE